MLKVIAGGASAKKYWGSRLPTTTKPKKIPFTKKLFCFNCLPVYTNCNFWAHIFLTNQFYARCRQENQGPHNDSTYQHKSKRPILGHSWGQGEGTKARIGKIVFTFALGPKCSPGSWVEFFHPCWSVGPISRPEQIWPKERQSLPIWRLKIIIS